MVTSTIGLELGLSSWSAIAQRWLITVGEGGGHAAAVPADGAVADGVDTELDAVQAPRLQPILDRPEPEAEPQQLPLGDDAALPCGETGDLPMAWAL